VTVFGRQERTQDSKRRLLCFNKNSSTRIRMRELAEHASRHFAQSGGYSGKNSNPVECDRIWSNEYRGPGTFGWEPSAAVVSKMLGSEVQVSGFDAAYPIRTKEEV